MLYSFIRLFENLCKNADKNPIVKINTLTHRDENKRVKVFTANGKYYYKKKLYRPT